MPRRKSYDPDWDKPETVARFVTDHPPTLTACSRLMADLADDASTPLHAAWFLAAAALLKAEAENA